MHAPTVFPTLAGRSWARVDLNALAAEAFGQSGPNPLLDPTACAAFVDRVAVEAGADFTYGGYLEDRSALWRGHYHAVGAMRHLGVDYNVPSGVPVAACADCEVVRVVKDPDQGGGWGGAAFMRLARPYRGADYVMYGHLAHDSLPEAGARIEAGGIVARIGEATENGGWFPHLHVQCFDRSLFDAHWPRLEGMDGYGPNDVVALPSMPDPTSLVAGRH